MSAGCSTTWSGRASRSARRAGTPQWRSRRSSTSVGLRPAGDRPAAESGLEAAVAGLPELRARPFTMRFGDVDDGTMEFSAHRGHYRWGSRSPSARRRSRARRPDARPSGAGALPRPPEAQRPVVPRSVVEVIHGERAHAFQDQPHAQSQGSRGTAGVVHSAKPYVLRVGSRRSAPTTTSHPRCYGVRLEERWGIRLVPGGDPVAVPRGERWRARSRVLQC